MLKKKQRFPLPDNIKYKIKNSFIYDILNPIRDKYLRKKEEIKKSYIKELLKEEKCPVILEIGANIGEDTVSFLQEFKKIKLYCFEPNPDAVKEWKETIRLFLKRQSHHKNSLVFFEIALWNKNRKEDFTIISNDPKHAAGSLKEQSDIYNKFVSGEPRIPIKKIKVQTKRLDTWVDENNIKKIDFIWADVEGAERELIKGGLKTLNNKTLYFYTECYEDKRYKKAQNLREILNLLPNFRVINLFGNNVLLKNSNLK